jgi:hypothetical protein
MRYGQAPLAFLLMRCSLSCDERGQNWKDTGSYQTTVEGTFLPMSDWARYYLPPMEH